MSSYTTDKHIFFAVGEERYAVNISMVKEIIRHERITFVRDAQKYLKGVINLRGEIIPVMSLRLKMGMEPDVITKATRIIIIKIEQHEGFGIIVDEVKEVVTLEKEQIEKMSYDKDEKRIFVYAVGKVEGALVSLLDLNAVLADA